MSAIVKRSPAIQGPSSSVLLIMASAWSTLAAQAAARKPPFSPSGAR
jgi:hypothetical protein